MNKMLSDLDYCEIIISSYYPISVPDDHVIISPHAVIAARSLST